MKNNSKLYKTSNCLPTTIRGHCRNQPTSLNNIMKENNKQNEVEGGSTTTNSVMSY